jgi:alkanesulfonate monooxygenase SsuD/methylene tetrahydromethanopterin reductase-like flavin-dependent oxidoreductase (luciferase family)
VDLAVHLPLIQFDDDALTLDRLHGTVDAARESGFAAVSSNDHLLFATPWLDGLAALAAVVERSGEMTLATTIALVVVRGPAPLAKALTAIDVMSGGRVVAGVGPGSSPLDYEAVGVPFEERWPRFDEAVTQLRRLVRPDSELAPRPAREAGIPIWIGSWGSAAGLRRVRRLADGWLASAYNTTPERFAEARRQLPSGFPNALSTMWTWVTESRAERDRVLRDVLGPLLRRDPEELGEQVCVGSAEHCAALLSRYAEAGCERVYLWPLGDEPHQLERMAADVAPQL